jgi:hypothetical protein
VVESRIKAVAAIADKDLTQPIEPQPHARESRLRSR